MKTNSALDEGLSALNPIRPEVARLFQWAAAGLVDTDLSFSSLFELYRADVAERGVPARRVVEPLDVVEHI